MLGYNFLGKKIFFCFFLFFFVFSPYLFSFVLENNTAVSSSKPTNNTGTTDPSFWESRLRNYVENDLQDEKPSLWQRAKEKTVSMLVSSFGSDYDKKMNEEWNNKTQAEKRRLATNVLNRYDALPLENKKDISNLFQKFVSTNTDGRKEIVKNINENGISKYIDPPKNTESPKEVSYSQPTNNTGTTDPSFWESRLRNYVENDLQDEKPGWWQKIKEKTVSMLVSSFGSDYDKKMNEEWNNKPQAEKRRLATYALNRFDALPLDKKNDIINLVQEFASTDIEGRKKIVKNINENGISEYIDPPKNTESPKEVSYSQPTNNTGTTTDPKGLDPKSTDKKVVSLAGLKVNNTKNKTGSTSSESCSGRDYGLVGFNGICDDELGNGWGYFIKLIERVLKWVIGLAFLLATFAIIWTGVILLVSNKSPEERSKVKSKFMNILIGLFLISSAWLIVSFIFSLFGIEGNRKEIYEKGDILIEPGFYVPDSSQQGKKTQDSRKNKYNKNLAAESETNEKPVAKSENKQNTDTVTKLENKQNTNNLSPREKQHKKRREQLEMSEYEYNNLPQEVLGGLTRREYQENQFNYAEKVKKRVKNQNKRVKEEDLKVAKEHNTIKNEAKFTQYNNKRKLDEAQTASQNYYQVEVGQVYEDFETGPQITIGKVTYYAVPYDRGINVIVGQNVISGFNKVVEPKKNK